MDLQVAYSSDDNYAQHVGVSMLSLFENNKEFDTIVVYILDNNISKDNKEKLAMIAEKYVRKIIIIEITSLLNKIPLHIGKTIAVSSYARLFLSSVVPNDVEKIIYIDCDCVVTASLVELWKTKLGDCYIAGVADTISQYSENYTEIGLQETDLYINAGMILINLNKWRINHIEQKLIDFIVQRKGSVRHHDQGTINGVLHGYCKIIHPKYNVMSVFFSMTKEQMIKYYHLRDYRYVTAELEEAIRMPSIIHYTPGFVGRPWVEGCKHPLKNKYIKYLKMTPWKDVPLQKDNRKAVEKSILFLYNHLPFNIAHQICKIAFKSLRGIA
jgi:lipopolysaccharide biosynthesis glycosyltransferase